MTILDRIIDTKRVEIEHAKRTRSPADVAEAARIAPEPRDFLSAVTAPSPRGPQLVAEIKKKSPSAGLICASFDPVEIARTYERHGAAAISVLTDETYFGGRLDFIRLVKNAVALPVLRKEFIIDEYQVYESRAAGADAMLLIVEAIGVERVAELAGSIDGLGMACLIEVHSEENLLALLDSLGPPVLTTGRLRESTDAGGDERNPRELKFAPHEKDTSRRLKPAARAPYILGINNRDLSVQRTDISTTARLARRLPAGSAFVAESGLTTQADLQAVHDAGACAVLIGESLLRENDIGAKLDELLAVR